MKQFDKKVHTFLTGLIFSLLLQNKKKPFGFLSLFGSIISVVGKTC